MMDLKTEFIKDKDVAKRIAYNDDYVRGQPIKIRMIQFMIYWSMRVMIIVFRWIRYMKYSLKLVYRGGINEE